MSGREKSRERLVGELSDAYRRLEASEAERGRLQEETERAVQDYRNLQETLRESEDVARALINAPTEAAFLIETGGRILIANETAARRHGKTVEEIVGTCIYDLLPPHLATSRRRREQEVIRSSKPVCIEDEREGRRYNSHVFPVFNSSGDVVRLAIVSHDVTERKQAEETLKKQTSRLQRSLEASDRDRRMIAYEIHDGLAQHLAGAMMQFQAFASSRSQNAEEASSAFDTGLELLREALAEVRRVIRGVRPPVLDELGLVAAVDHLVESTESEGAPKIEFDADVRFDRLDSTLENSLFRIVQEGLANACKHSESDRVRVALVQQNKTLRIEVQDWGRGFEVDGARDGRFGLVSIRERAKLLDGRAAIESKPGVGTRVVVEVPLP